MKLIITLALGLFFASCSNKQINSTSRDPQSMEKEIIASNEGSNTIVYDLTRSGVFEVGYLSDFEGSTKLKNYVYQQAKDAGLSNLKKRSYEICIGRHSAKDYSLKVRDELTNCYQREGGAFTNDRVVCEVTGELTCYL